jgi:hypothetical protein
MSGLEDGPDAFEHIQAKASKFRAAMIDGRHGNCRKDGERNVRRTGDLQEMAAGLICH